MKSFEFVMVSQNDEFKMSRDATLEVEKAYPSAVFHYVSGNKLPLADVYNTFIKMHRQKHDVDYLVLMHADVSFDAIKLMQHIESVDGKYDVLGLCGCEKLSIGSSPLNWFTGSKCWPNRRWGCVSHGELGGQTSFFSQHHPNVLDHQVACIDGLCIILSRKTLEQSDVLFDPRFSFSHYDTDFSLECTMKRHMKLGVVVREDLQHWSVGKSITQPSFLESESAFRQKWGFAANQKA